MELSALKPWLTALIMPPASLLLLAGLALLASRRWRRTALALAWGSLAVLWLLATQAVAVALGACLLPAYPALSAAQIQAAKKAGAQSIVVLGGGIEPRSSAYGDLDLVPAAYARLRYGYYLKSLTGLPLGYSGGSGWSSRSAGLDGGEPGLGAALQNMLRQDGRAALDWVEDRSRDTHENAVFTARLLRAQGVQHVFLVTHAWHMPRSVRAFEAAGLRVIPAPMGQLQGADNWQQHWLPSGQGLQSSYSVLREWLGLRMRAY